jgi:hypothetical protein
VTRELGSANKPAFTRKKNGSIDGRTGVAVDVKQDALGEVGIAL